MGGWLEEEKREVGGWVGGRTNGYVEVHSLDRGHFLAVDFFVEVVFDEDACVRGRGGGVVEIFVLMENRQVGGWVDGRKGLPDWRDTRQTSAACACRGAGMRGREESALGFSIRSRATESWL